MRDYIYSLLPATFGEIVQACRDGGYETTGDMELVTSDGIMCAAVSNEFAEAVYSLVIEGKVRVARISNIDYLTSSPLVLVNCPKFVPVRLEIV